jgi:FKBP-type peptidyl-prolyl cis-trans isomerase
VTQTTNNTTNTSRRPGQRQQERLMRQARRRRRQNLIISGAVAVVVLLAAIGWVIFAARQSEDRALQANVNATATTNGLYAQATQTSNAANVQATATVEGLIKANPKSAPKPPVVTTAPTKLPGGLEYITITKGTGAAIQATSTINVEYTGWIQQTGKEFDSSYDHGGTPFGVTLGAGQVIPGWDQGLVGMKIGETRRLIIPPALGYGKDAQTDQTTGKVVIPANSTLIFDVTATSFGDVAATATAVAASQAAGQ